MAVRFFAALVLVLAFLNPAVAQRSSGAPKPDGFTLADVPAVGQSVHLQTAGTTPRIQTINPAQTTLVLIVAGQSNWMNINPTTFIPTNTASIDQFNIYDGGSYSITGALLGTTTSASSSYGVGNVAARVAEYMITNSAAVNRVILVPVAVGGTLISQWGTGGVYADRIPAAIRRLASRGITPATPGVVMGLLWGQGESDSAAGTLQAAYATSLGQVISNAQAAGFSGRVFVCKETWQTGSVSSAVQAAQTGIINGSTIFSGGDLDTLNATNRYADNTHFNDTGAAAAALIVFTAMHASGTPY